MKFLKFNSKGSSSIVHSLLSDRINHILYIESEVRKGEYEMIPQFLISQICNGVCSSIFEIVIEDEVVSLKSSSLELSDIFGEIMDVGGRRKMEIVPFEVGVYRGEGIRSSNGQVVRW